LTRPATIALVLLVVQLFLGIAAYMTRLASPNDPQPLNPMIAITVAHVACGALVFVTTIVLTLRAYRVLPAAQKRVMGRKTTGVIDYLMEEFAIDLRSSAVDVVERTRFVVP
jgi:heme A synthase